MLHIQTKTTTEQKPPPKIWYCSKCGRPIVGTVYRGYGFAYHPRCYAAIYGWPRD